MTALLRTAIAKPVAAFSLALLVMLFGVLALFQMPVQLTPTVELPQITVSTSWPGASPLEVERELILRQEEQLESLDGLVRMESSSSEEKGSIELTFGFDTDIDGALVQVANRLEQVPERPANARQPVIEPVGSDATNVAWFMLQPSGERRFTGDVTELGTLSEEIIEPRLERVTGVARVAVLGTRTPRLEVRVDPDRLAARRITLDEVAAALDRENRDWSGGDLDRGKHRYLVRAVSTFRSPADVEAVNVALRDGVPVRVGDVAEVALGYEDLEEAGFFLGRPAVGISVQKKVSANVLDVMDELQETVGRLNEDILAPRGLRLTQSYDETEYIGRAISLVRQSLLIGGVLATLVLLLFLRSRSATLVVTASIPISLAGACLVLWLAGSSLNVLTLAGLAFAVGMVVDNTIVVLENIVRHRQSGLSRRRAAYRATREVWGAVVASTTTTIAVFLPVVFVRGELGQLFRDLALAIAAAVGCSLLVSVAVLPGIAARVLDVPRDVRILGSSRRRRGAWLQERSARLSEALSHAVYRLCGTTRRRLGVVAAVTAVAVVGAWLLIPESGYLPNGNRNSVVCFLEPPPGYNLAQVMSYQDIFQESLAPAWQASSDQAAAMPGGGIRSSLFVATPSFAFVNLRARDPQRAAELLPELEAAAAKVPGVRASVVQRSLFDESFAAGRSIELDIAGPDLERLWPAAEAARERIERVLPGSALRLSPNPAAVTREIRIEPDRYRLAELGLGSDAIGRLTASLVDGDRVGTYLQDGREIDLVIISGQGPARSLQEIHETPVPTSGGHLVTLSAVAAVSETTSPSSIRRLHRQRTVTVKVLPPPEISLEVAVGLLRTEVVDALREEGLLGEDQFAVVSGSADKLALAGRDMAWVLALAGVLVFLLMAALFESFLYPLVILWTVPLAALGGFVGLRVLGLFTPQLLDVLAMLGFVILVGTVVNNAILLVHQALQHRRRDEMSHRDAVTAAARNRVRPIFMSAATSIFGMLPLVLFPGAGSELYRGLGSVVVGGLALSTLLTLLVVPALLSLALEGREALRRSTRPRLAIADDSSRFDVSTPPREGSGTFATADPSGTLDW